MNLLTRPQYDSRFHVDAQPKRVVFFSGRENHLYTGKLVAQIAACINGLNTVEQIIANVEGEFSFLEIIYAIDSLHEQGIIVAEEDVSNDIHHFQRLFFSPEEPSLCAAVVGCSGAYGLGKGIGEQAAFASALSEAMEIESTFQRSREALLLSDDHEFRRIIHPNSVQLLSDSQLALLEQHDSQQWLPLVDHGGQISYLQIDVALPGCFDLNGTGCSLTLPRAINHGLLELIERDAAAIWWYNKLKRPEIGLDDIDDAYLKQVKKFFAKRDSSFWILDITSDLGIPVMAAISSHPLCIGFSAHTNSLTAARNAAAELIQMSLLRDHAEDLWSNPSSISWWNDMKIEEERYLYPSEKVAIRSKLSTSAYSCLRAKDFDIFVLDCSQPRSDHKVVRTFVPGLRKPQPRFGLGRLYEVPVQLGDFTTKKGELQMNRPLFPEYLQSRGA
jgi:ribosomal protein S12 methylthiotransferase accessory factor YcaO